ncbi:MAG: BON domain-containing protein, partial [bacterium]
MGNVTVSDDTIQQEIEQHLEWNQMIDAEKVDVEVRDGSVWLTGSVSSYRAKGEAEDIVYDIQGVKKLTNDLVVTISERKQSVSDAKLQSRAEKILGWDDEIDVSHIQVTAENGFVTLKGTVDENWKVLYALSKVGELEGVIDVYNELSVVPNFDRTD